MSSKSAHHHFHSIDILIVVVSLGTFVLDFCTDLFVCIELFWSGHYVWGWLMVGFIAVPALLMNAFSISWHLHDKSATWPVVVSHIFMLAPAERYCKVIQLGIRSFKTQKAVFTQRALRSQSDVSILRLFEAFLESAPQLVLQLYIIFDSNKGNWFTVLSAVCSLVSLTWAMTAYSDSQRKAHCFVYKRRLVRLLMHYLWQLFMTGSRIAAFVFCAFALGNWVLAVMGGHWLIAFVWISIRGTDFGTDCCERWVFRLVCGFIYIFVFLNLNDGMSRWRVTAYYVLVLLENTGMLVVYVILEGSANGIVSAFALVYGAYMLGLVCMALYYSYLHPSGRKKSLPSRKPNDSVGPSFKDDPQIFSIESPKLENDLAGLEGPGINLTMNANSFQSSVEHSKATHPSLLRSGKSGPAVRRVSQEALHAAWQSGMISSSSSDSSLNSDTKVAFVREGKRVSSVKSVHSHASSSSENHLLPVDVDKKNDLSKPSGQEFAVPATPARNLSNDISKKDISKSDNNINIQSNLSDSPTLSRGSWARLSDNNRQSLTLGDFTVLGFDDDSSLDRQRSDCSSLNSQPKSLSPINVSSLLKDVHSRLRATIAATIAAATSNPSSSEGTPNGSRSIASSASGQEDSLKSGNLKSASSLKHISLAGESLLKDKEEDQPLNLSLQSMAKKREGLSSLPDTPQTFSPDQMSDMATTDSSYDRFGSETNNEHHKDVDSGAVIEISGKSPSSYSSYPEDSTLTASKLDTKLRPSYLEVFSQENSYINSPEISHPEEPLDLSMSSNMSGGSRTLRSTVKRANQKEASPFTDQELVSVMAKSLQTYLRDTPIKSPNPEREGLALTIEDLRISRESSPQAQLNKQDVGEWKSRSASSLFHDSSDTSPVSSASKMHRAASVAKAETKLSPNALKQLEVSPQTLSITDHTSLQESSQSHVQHPMSHGLKFIMDSYGQTSLFSPNRSKLRNAKLEDNFISQKRAVHSDNHTKSRSSEYKSPETDKCSHDMLRHAVRDSSKDHFMQDMESPQDSFQSTPGPGLSAKDLELSFAEVQSGRSYRKTSDLQQGNFHLLQYSRSPFHQQKSHGSIFNAPQETEAQGYVSGQYHPPLCTNIKPDSHDNSYERNINSDRRNSYNLNSVKKNIHDLLVGRNSGLGANRQGTNLERSFQKDLRRGLMKRNLFLENQTLDSLHQSQSSISGCYSYSDRQSQPDLHSRETDAFGSNLPLNSTINHLGNGQRATEIRRSSSGNVYDMLSEDELQKSAKDVTDYFSQVFESTPHIAWPSNSSSKSQLKIHHKRSPLQQLDNAQHVSPKTISYHKSLNRSSHQDWSGTSSTGSRPPMSHYRTNERAKNFGGPKDFHREK